MKIHIETKTLQQIFKKFNKLDYRHSADNELQQSILVDTEMNKDMITFIACNYGNDTVYADIEMMAKVPAGNAQILENGSTLLPHSMLKTILSLDCVMDSWDLAIKDNSIAYDNNEINFAPIKYDFITLNLNSIKCMNILTKTTEKDLYRHLKNVFYAVEKDATRPTLTTVNIRQNRFCALNAFRIAISKADVLSESEFNIGGSINLPANLVQLLLKVCDRNSDKQVSIFTDNSGKYINFEFESFSVISELPIQEEYINYENIIPVSDAYKVIIVLTADSLLKKLKTITNLRPSEKDIIRLTICKDGRDQLLIEEKSQLKYAKAEIPIAITQFCNYDEEGHLKPFKICLNPYFLKDPLQKYSSEEIEMDFSTDTNPIVITPVGNKDNLDLILPIRVADDAEYWSD